MDLTVIIPTYQRGDALRRALVSLSLQTLTGFEVLVIDNAASPDIERLVLELAKTAAPTMRYLPEPTLGLHHARHAGARAAKGQLLVFTDDDATFAASWLDAYSKAFSEHPEMAAAGGPIRPVWDVPPPQWLQDYMGNSPLFPILSLMDLHRDFLLGPRGFFFGANMAIRRDVLFDVGGFNPEAFGDVWLGDGESGLNRKLWDRGALVGYVPEAIVYHHIPAERMTLKYCRRRMANEGACQAYSAFHSGIPGWGGLLARASAMIVRYGPFWLASGFVRGSTHRLFLRLQLFTCRTRSQLDYVYRLMRDQEFRKFVVRKNWLSEAGPDTL